MWTDKWPWEPGYYWFYGWCFKSKSGPPRMLLVKVFGEVARIMDGCLFYKEDVDSGQWLKIIPPECPEDK